MKPTKIVPEVVGLEDGMGKLAPEWKVLKAELNDSGGEDCDSGYLKQEEELFPPYRTSRARCQDIHFSIWSRRFSVFSNGVAGLEDVVIGWYTPEWNDHIKVVLFMMIFNRYFRGIGE